MEKLHVVELFSGLGAQSKALKNININYEVVGISEWDVNAIISYDAIHTNDGVDYTKDMNKEEILEKLSKFTFTTDGKKPCNMSRLNNKKLRQLYNANLRSRNLGDITKIDETKLPDFDFLTFSFPCQAFSVAGKREGFADPRGTMFFESFRILRHKLPKYFLFENVPGLLSHDKGNTIRVIMECLGQLPYEITMNLVNSKDMGTPQNRLRLFGLGRRIN